MTYRNHENGYTGPVRAIAQKNGDAVTLLEQVGAFKITGWISRIWETAAAVSGKTVQGVIEGELEGGIARNDLPIVCATIPVDFWGLEDQDGFEVGLSLCAFEYAMSQAGVEGPWSMREDLPDIPDDARSELEAWFVIEDRSPDPVDPMYRAALEAALSQDWPTLRARSEDIRRWYER